MNKAKTEKWGDDTTKITVGQDVLVESTEPIDQAVVRDLVARYPVGATVGETFARFGRAALRSVLDAFPGAAFCDNRVYADLDVDVEPRFPNKKYDLDAWAAGDGGFIFYPRGALFRAVPNMIRNLVCALRHPAVVVVGDHLQERDVLQWFDRIGFDDWREYSRVITVVEFRKAVMPAGLVVVLCPGYDDVLENLAESNARYRFVIDVPGTAEIERAACFLCSVGPVLWNGRSKMPLVIQPVATPFSDPVMKPDGRVRGIDMPATLVAMMGCGARSAVLGSVISHMRTRRNLFLTERVAIYHQLQHILDDLRTQILVPLQFSALDDHQAVIRRCRECGPREPLSLLATYDDVIAHADQLPSFDQAFLLTPAGSVRQLKALAPVRDPAGDFSTASRRVIDFVDKDVPGILDRARTRHRLFLERAGAVIKDIDTRYV
jgi:hypothetical protein